MDDVPSTDPSPGEDARDPLEARLTRLEAEVRTLRADVARLAETVRAAPPPAAAAPEDRPASPAEAPSPTREAPSAAPEDPTKRSLWHRVQHVLEGANWLNLIGIGLLLFGVLFLFKYAIDQGWITPLVRVAAGVGIGIGLMVAGGRLKEARPALSQVLLGGGIAALYASIFAAYQLYELLPYALAFAAMVGITGVAFALSVRQDRAVLAVIGTAGGLATPFLLYVEGGTLAGLAGYTSLVLLGAGAIYWRHAWATLAWTAFVVGTLALLAGAVDILFNASTTMNVDRAAFQGSVLVLLAISGFIPSMRALRTVTAKPTPWTPVLLALGAPVVVLTLTAAAWDLPDLAMGLIALGSALGYAGGYVRLHRATASRLAQAHGLAAAALAIVAWHQFFEVPARALFLAAEAVLLLTLARWQGAASFAWAGRALLAGVASLVLNYLVYVPALQPPLLNGPALALGLAILGGGLAALLAQRSVLRVVYASAAHGLTLGWLLHQLVPLPNGQAYASIAWAIYALVLLAIGVRTQRFLLRRVALGTLLLLVAKLFVVDLAQLSAGWRILLFLGIGASFLLLSYAFPSLWQPPGVEPSPEEPASEDVPA
ncbi:MAG: DUF2339 domain-containing protein [Bacteroidetes bacterium]|jgi:uncharacterized membrane protein|nr:DUF2339 domain-containing protein [Bacteroidota bacterium]